MLLVLNPFLENVNNTVQADCLDHGPEADESYTIDITYNLVLFLTVYLLQANCSILGSQE